MRTEGVRCERRLQELQVRPHWSRARGGISGGRSCSSWPVAAPTSSSTPAATRRRPKRWPKRPRLSASGSLVVMGDGADKATVERMRTQAEETFGGVDIYVSNAARRLYKDFFTITDEEWDYHLNQQLTASWYLAKALVPGMRDRGWGRIVHINGEYGWLGGWTRIPHSVGKGGLRTLTKSL